MFSEVSLAHRLDLKVNTAPGKKGAFARIIWKILRQLFIQIMWEILNEEKERLEGEEFDIIKLPSKNVR